MQGFVLGVLLAWWMGQLMGNYVYQVSPANWMVLGGSARETDLVARPGGDEFLLLLADLDPASASHGERESVSVAAESVALRIQEELRTPFTVGETELYVTASLGISAYPDDAVDAPMLLKNAETAMIILNGQLYLTTTYRQPLW